MKELYKNTYSNCKFIDYMKEDLLFSIEKLDVKDRNRSKKFVGHREELMWYYDL